MIDIKNVGDLVNPLRSRRAWENCARFLRRCSQGSILNSKSKVGKAFVEAQFPIKIIHVGTAFLLAGTFFIDNKCNKIAGADF